MQGHFHTHTVQRHMILMHVRRPITHDGHSAQPPCGIPTTIQRRPRARARRAITAPRSPLTAAASPPPPLSAAARGAPLPTPHAPSLGSDQALHSSRSSRPQRRWRRRVAALSRGHRSTRTPAPCTCAHRPGDDENSQPGSRRSSVQPSGQWALQCECEGTRARRGRGAAYRVMDDDG